MDTMIKKRIERLSKINLDIPATTKKEKIWEIFSKKFAHLEKEEAFYLKTKERVEHEILQPLSRMRYQLVLYQQMGIEQQLAKSRVKRL
jgi:hypothetical protein